jgi:hypothetical protein
MTSAETPTPFTREQNIARFGEDSLNCLSVMSGVYQDERIAEGYLTLGDLIEALNWVCADTPVMTDDRHTLGAASSYRGYYVDLAFAPSTLPQNAAGLHALLTATLGAEYDSWKGNARIRMNANTPIWLAAEGEATGTYFTGVRTSPDGLVLITANEYND